MHLTAAAMLQPLMAAAARRPLADAPVRVLRAKQGTQAAGAPLAVTWMRGPVNAVASRSRWAAAVRAGGRWGSGST